MTPKEKAKELVDRYITLFKHYDANPKLNIGLNKYFKQCALITVDEIIKNQNNIADQMQHSLILKGIKTITMQSDYWNNVKREIERYEV